MLRKSFLPRQSAFPSQYVPNPIVGRDWTPASAEAGRRKSSSSSSPATKMLLQQQQATFFKPKSTTTSSAFLRKQFQEATAVATNTFRETEAAVKNFEENIKTKAGFYFLPQLDYSIADGVAPVISKTQTKLTYEVHHRGIVDCLNTLTLGTIYEGHPLDAVILHTAFDAENAAIHTAAC